MPVLIFYNKLNSQFYQKKKKKIKVPHKKFALLSSIVTYAMFWKYQL